MRRPKWLRCKDRSSGGNASLSTSRGPSNEQNASSDTTSDSTACNPTTKNLWDEAYIELRSSQIALVDRFEQILLSESSGDDGATSRREQLSRTIENKLALMEQDKWVINFAGKSLEVRKQVERLVKVVQIMRDSVTVIANIEPVHLGIPVAAIRLLTPVSLKPRLIYFRLRRC